MKSGLHIDYAALDKLEKLQIPGEPDMILELIDLFNQQKVEMVKSVKAAVARGDFSSVGDECHRFKSTCWTLGATVLGNLLEDVEQAALKCDLTGVKIKFQIALSELEQAKEELNGLKAKRTA